MRGLVTAIVALVAAAPSAQAQSACAAAYTTDQLLNDMMAVEGGLRENDTAAVAKSGTNLETGIGCLQELLPAVMVGRTYRAIAAGKLASEEEGAARGWFATSVEIDSTFEYGLEDIPAEHRVREVYADLKIAYVPDPITVEGRVLGAGTYYVDGRKISTPTAVDGRPHLLQIDRDGVISSTVIKGIRFPEDLLVDPAAAVAGGGKDKGKKDKAKDPKQATPLPTNPSGVMMAGRTRPGEKTPLLVTGVATMIGSGAVFAYTYKTRAQFFACTSDPICVSDNAKLTNNLNLLGAGVGALGLATFTWGAMVDDGGRFMPTFHVRF